MNIHQIWYGPIVYPIIAVLVLIALFLMIQTYKYIKKEQIICSIPRYSIRLFIIMMILSQIVFEKNPGDFFSHTFFDKVLYISVGKFFF